MASRSSVSRRREGGALAVGSRLLVAAALTSPLACTDVEPAPAETGGFAFWFAPLTGTGCGPTSNGQSKVPDDVSGLAVTWTAALKTTTGETQTGTVRGSRGDAKGGVWQIKDIPVSDDVDIEVYGCSADKKISYVGHHRDLKVEEAKDTTARIFLAPVGKLACTGSPTGAAKLQAPRSLAGTAVLPGGDVAVVGGLGDWSSSGGGGTATNAIDVYDYRNGHFRKGPTIVSARLLPHVHAVGAGTKLLVAGGLTEVRLSSKLALSLPLVPDKIEAALPTALAEVVDASQGESAKGEESDADIGVGKWPFSSSIHLEKDIVFVGGVDGTGTVVDQATRLSGLDDVAAGKPGLSASIKLNAARLRPALLRFPDDTVLVWGGAKTAAGMGELIGPQASGGEALTVTGPDSLLKDKNLPTMAPVAVSISGTGDVLTFLVAGGVPYEVGDSAELAPTYAVVVTKSAKTAELKPVTISGGTLRAGLYTAGVQLPSRQLLLAGGLVAPYPVPAVCNNPDECLLDTFTVLAPPADLTAAELALTVVSSGSLGGGRFGLVAAPLPAGALLAGGQASVRKGDTAEALDDVGEVMTFPPADLDVAKICGK